MMMKKEDILKLENQLYEAMKSADIEALDNLLHNDLLFIIPSGEVINKEKDLESYRTGNLKIIELQPDVEHLNIIDDVAIINLKLKLNGSFSGDPFEAQFRYIRFWKEFEDGIKVIGGSGIAI
ncbi:nuclear transport factor 2 family protein [Sphingobacterium mizutaii]|nr:nuclear transport factor 2 family protein [Sphingobacterium mizutaii]